MQWLVLVLVDLFHDQVYSKKGHLVLIRTNYFLCVFQAQLEDSGPYMCQLNTDPMKSKMGILNVIIRPDIIEVTGSRVVTEGGNIR